MKNKNVSKEAVPFGKRVLGFVQNNSVPLMFVLICIICIPISGFSVGYLINEIVTRMGRNIFLILCLLFPIMAGMGLNFGMTLGAMAGEIALIFVADWQVWGIPGVVLAMILSVPEGDDKPLKYPLMFSICDVLLVNKIDVAPYFNFDLDKCIERVKKLNPNIQVFPISALKGEGIEPWADWLREQTKTWNA